MARGWIASSLLLSSFWWYAMKRAVEVSNYLPIKVDNAYSTPHTLAFGQKPDLRNLLPMFAVAHIRCYYDSDNKAISNTDNQSTSDILLGRAEHSTSTFFYHPSTGRTIISDDFYLDETSTTSLHTISRRLHPRQNHYTSSKRGRHLHSPAIPRQFPTSISRITNSY